MKTMTRSKTAVRNPRRRPSPVNEQRRQQVMLATMVLNQEVDTLLSRRALMDDGPDPRRDMNEECGWPETITINDYARMYSRLGPAKRVVDIYPAECFAVQPQIFENEEGENTEFEQSWIDLLNRENMNPLHYMQRVDVMSGIGQYGILLMGLKGPLDSIVDGINEDGSYGTIPERQPLLYLRAFEQSKISITDIEVDELSPRYGKPTMYEIRLGPTRTNGTEGTEMTTERTIRAHWSRIIHVADNRMDSEVYGVPRMQSVFNMLMDVQKILGSSAEMFYKGGFPGLSLELDPRILDALNITAVDDDAIKDEMFAYQNGLQRYVWLQGLTAKSLAPQVADPKAALEAQYNSIAMSIGAPLRIFMGSEQAQLASGQDVRTWNRRLINRQEQYISPMILRPFVNRLIAAGVLAAPKKWDPKTGHTGYEIWWPDVNIPNDDERSTTADRLADAMSKYMSSKAYQIMQPSVFFRTVMGFTHKEVEMMVTEAKKKPELKIKEEVVKTPGDTGVRGKAKSKPKAGGKSAPPSGK